MAKLEDLVAYCDKRTRRSAFKDAPGAFNGLQVANNGRVTKIGAAVDAGVVPFRKAVAAQPDSIPAHFNLGAALTQTGDLSGAVEQFEVTLRLDPAHANAHSNLGLLLAQANRHEQAIAHLRSAIAAQPNDNNARFLLAQESSESVRFVERKRLGRMRSPEFRQQLFQIPGAALEHDQARR